MFQSPQWGNNSKGTMQQVAIDTIMFQSSQWGNNSKETSWKRNTWLLTCFSPLSGEVILKYWAKIKEELDIVSVPSVGK